MVEIDGCPGNASRVKKITKICAINRSSWPGV
jgi:hypothetical protein